MTIDEAIRHCEEVAEKNESRAKRLENAIGKPVIKYKNDCAECAADHRQLAEWLTELKHLKQEVNQMKPDLDSKNAELKEAKRLLKLAVEDMNDNNICYDINPCNVCTENKKCPCDTFKWRYTDEALKLLEEDGDTK